MTDYARLYNFTSKDGLVTGDPAKRARGAEIDDELNAVATAVNSKIDKPSSPVNGDLLEFDSGSNSWVASSAAKLPVATIVSTASATLPTGWLWCDGSLVGTVTYPDLFTAIGYQYGGSGANFNLPDLRGRAIFGLDNMNNSVGVGGGDAGRLGNVVNGDILGSSGGAEIHTLTTAELPAHSHAITVELSSGTSGKVGSGGGGSTAVDGTSGGSVGSGNAHTNQPPTLILNYIIFTGV